MRQKILDAIVAYMLRQGYPPTIREIGEAVGLKSTSTVESHLRRMELEGMILRNEGPRTIEVPGVRYVDERWKI